MSARPDPASLLRSFIFSILGFLAAACAVFFLIVLTVPGASTKAQRVIISLDPRVSKLIDVWGDDVLFIAPDDIARLKMRPTFWPLHDMSFAMTYESGQSVEVYRKLEVGGYGDRILIEFPKDITLYLMSSTSDVCFYGFSGKVDDELMRKGVQRILLNDLQVVITSTGMGTDKLFRFGKCE